MNKRTVTSRRIERVVLAALVAGHIVFNLFFGPFEQAPSLGQNMAWGVIGVQPILLAAWLVFGPGAVLHRLGWSLFSMVLVSMALVISAFGRQHGHVEVGTMVVPVLQFLGLAFLFSFVRLRSGLRMDILEVPAAPNQGRPYQFELIYLFGWLAGFAVLMGIWRPIGETIILGWIWQGMIIFGVILFLVSAPAITLLWAMLSRLTVGKTLVFVLIGWPLATTLACVVGLIAVLLPKEPPPLGLVRTFLGVQLGAAAGGCISAFTVRQFGYRLRIPDGPGL